MDERLRIIGFEEAGLLLWGAHIGLFYRNQAELSEALAQYFKAGLENNEMCLWIASDQASKEQLRRALERRLPEGNRCGLARYRRLGQLEILDFREWYIQTGLSGLTDASAAAADAASAAPIFNPHSILESWLEKERQARQLGFDGLRAAGDTAWLKALFQEQQIAWNHEIWSAHMDYESRFSRLMHPGLTEECPRLLALCTYNLNQCSPAEIIEITANHELTLIHQDGGRPGNGGRPGDGWRAIFSAVYDQAEEAMEASQRSYRALVQSSSDHIFMLSADGVYRTSNDRVAQFGLNWAEDLVGRRLEDVYPPEIAESYRQQLERVIASGLTVEFEHPMSEPGGERVHLDTLYPIYRYGLVWAVGGVCHDITERKRAERLQIEREQRLQSVLQVAPDALFIKDRDLRYTLVNPAISEIFNLPEHKLLGQTDHQLFGAAAASLEISDRRALAGEPVEERVFLPVNDESHIFHIIKTPLRDETGLITGLSGVARDLTRNLREQIRLNPEPDSELFMKQMQVSLEEIKQQNDDLTRAMQNVEQEQHHYRRLFTDSLAPCLVSDARGMILEANQAAGWMFDSQPEKLAGRSMEEFVIEQERERLRKLLPPDLDLTGFKNLSGLEDLGLTFSFHSHHPQPDGPPIPLTADVFVAVERGENGQIERLLWMLRDETARKQDAAWLRLQNELLDNVSEAVVASDANYRLIYWNKAAERLYGWRAAEVLGRHGLEVVQTEWPGIDKEEMLREIQQTGSFVGEATQSHRDGHRLEVEAHSQVLKDESGGVRGYISVNHDIRERQQARAALEASEKRYQDLFEHMLEGFAYCQIVYAEEPLGAPVDFIYLKVNNAFGELTGLKEAVGKPVSQLIPGVHQTNPELLEVYSRVAQTGQPERFETYLPGLDIWFKISVYSYEAGYFAAVFDNITESKRREQALQEALADKEILLKEVHHRVKNNLAVVSSLLSLQASASQDPQLKAALRDSQQRIQAMAAIHEHLYHSENLAQVDMRGFVLQLIEQVRDLYRCPEVIWEMNIEPVSLNLEQAIPCGLIISELTTNALKHAFGARRGHDNGDPPEASPTVRISFQPDGVNAQGRQNYILRVSDNGVGLPSDFDPAKSRQVGMRLLYGLAGQLDGALERSNPGEGSVFTITFPEGRPV